MGWSQVHVVGSAIHRSTGPVSTRQNLNGHRRGFITSEEAAVLGPTLEGGADVPESTTASWRLPSISVPVDSIQTAYLVIAARRRFGGLHTSTYNKRVDVFLNGQEVESFNLRDKPAGHSDYFHRPDVPPLLEPIPPFDDCQTVYAWALDRNMISALHEPEVEVRIERGVNWDIDRVGVIFQSDRHRVFISYSSLDSAQAKKIKNHISKAGIGVWIDFNEILPGDSLIKRISTAISRVDLVVALLSQNSVDSKWVQQELEQAMTKEVHGRTPVIIPVRLDDCTFPAFLRHKLYVDMRLRAPYKALVRSVRGLLDRRTEE